MSFFKRDEDTPTENLRLKDFDRIWTKFCFLDETGSLDDAKDPYFTIGLLKMSQPYYLQSKILHERSKQRFYDELKFNKLSKNNLEFAKFVINSVFDTRSVDFYSYTTKKDSHYFLNNFGGNTWKAYEAITLKLLGAALSEQEIIILIADHVTTPKEVRFEVNTKKQFNASMRRLALAGVSRFDSRSNDLLQVVDLLIGAITYDLKLYSRIVSGSQYKIALVDLLKHNLGIDTFQDGFRNKNFSVFVERGGGENEKRPSS